MRRLVSLSLLAFIAAGPESKTFTDPQSRFSLNYPTTWTVAAPPPEGRAFSATVDTGGTTRPAATAVIAVTIQDDPAAGPDAKTLRDVSQSLTSFVFNHGGRHVVIKSDTLSTLPARRLRFVNPAADGDTAAVYVIAVKDKRTYTLTLIAPAEDVDAATAAFDAMLKTFKVGS